MIIERAKIKDAKEILDLQKLAYESEAEIYNDYTILPLTQTLEGIRTDFESHVFLKASVDRRIIGSVRAHTRQETCLIGRLIVHPDFQNQDIGTKLIAEIERYFSNIVMRFELFTGHEELSETSIFIKSWTIRHSGMKESPVI